MRRIGLMVMILWTCFGVCAQEIPATKVTLSLDGVPLDEALRKITQASGTPTTFRDDGGGASVLARLAGLDQTRRVTLEARDEPYWNVIVDLRDKCHLRLADLQGEDVSGVVLERGKPAKPPECISGACLFRLMDAEVGRDRDFRGSSRKRISLTMAMQCERKAGVFKISGPVIERAETEGGASLAPKETADPYFGDMTNPSGCWLSVDLKYLPEMKSLKVLSGKVWVIQELKSEDWVIEDLSKAVGETHTVCDLDELKITGMERGINALTLKMDVAPRTQGSGLITYRTLERRIRCQGEEGVVEMKVSFEGSKSEMEGGKPVYHNTNRLTPVGDGDVGKLKKMIIRLPAEVKAVGVPFEFKDVEMP